MLDRGECTFWFFLSLQMFATSASLPFRKFNNLLHLLRFGRNNIPTIVIFIITATKEEMAGFRMGNRGHLKLHTFQDHTDAVSEDFIDGICRPRIKMSFPSPD